MKNHKIFSRFQITAASTKHNLQEIFQSNEISSQYKVLQLIGAGAFGQVFKVLDLKSFKQYALKVTLQQKRYKNREYEIVKSLNHHNIVQIRQAYFTDYKQEKRLNIVMDIVETDIQQILFNLKRKKARVEKFTIKLWVFQMLKALAYLCDINLCHRDLKPSNILIDTNTNSLRLCDFGSAKLIQNGQPNVCYMCTRYYRPPQLLFGFTDYSTEVDMWGFGCILVEILTLDPPFCGQSTLDQIIQIFKILGTPPENYLKKSPDFSYSKLPPLKPRSWALLLKQFFPEPDLVDLIGKVLVIEKEKRIKPYEALLHPYFAQLISPQRQNITSRIPDLFDFSCNLFRESPKIKQLIEQRFSVETKFCEDIDVDDQLVQTTQESDRHQGA